MGKTYWQAIVEAYEAVPANRSVAERSLLLGSTDPRPARSLDVVAGATSGLLSPFFVAPVHVASYFSCAKGAISLDLRLLSCTSDGAR